MYLTQRDRATMTKKAIHVVFAPPAIKAEAAKATKAEIKASRKIARARVVEDRIATLAARAADKAVKDEAKAAKAEAQALAALVESETAALRRIASRVEERRDGTAAQFEYYMEYFIGECAKKRALTKAVIAKVGAKVGAKRARRIAAKKTRVTRRHAVAKVAGKVIAQTKGSIAVRSNTTLATSAANLRLVRREALSARREALVASTWIPILEDRLLAAEKAFLNAEIYLDTILKAEPRLMKDSESMKGDPKDIFVAKVNQMVREAFDKRAVVADALLYATGQVYFWNDRADETKAIVAVANLVFRTVKDAHLDLVRATGVVAQFDPDSCNKIGGIGAATKTKKGGKTKAAKTVAEPVAPTPEVTAEPVQKEEPVTLKQFKMSERISKIDELEAREPWRTWAIWPNNFLEEASGDFDLAVKLAKEANKESWLKGLAEQAAEQVSSTPEPIPSLNPSVTTEVVQKGDPVQGQTDLEIMRAARAKDTQTAAEPVMAADIHAKLKELGLDPDNFDHLIGVDENKARYAILQFIANRAGWTEAEVKLYQDSDGSASWIGLETVRKYIAAGIRPFPKTFRDALAADTVAVIGYLNVEWARAFDNVPVVHNVEDLKAAYAEGARVFLGDKKRLASLGKKAELGAIEALHIDTNDFLVHAISEITNPTAAIYAILPKARMDGCSVIGTIDYYDVEFNAITGDLDNKRMLPEIRLNGKMIKRENVMILWALLASNMHKGSQLRKLTGMASSCWLTDDENEYVQHQPDSCFYIQMHNVIGFARVTKNNGVNFVIDDMRTVEQIAEAARDFVARKVPVAFHKTLSRLYYGDGARVCGFNLNEGGFVTVKTGQDKGDAKLHTRYNTAVKAGATIKGEDGIDRTVRSGFGTLLANGSTAHQYGFAASVALTDWCLADNSGVAASRKGFFVPCTVTKTETVVIAETDRDIVIAEAIIRKALGKDAAKPAVLEAAARSILRVETAPRQYGDPILYVGERARAFLKGQAMNANVLGDPKVRFISGKGIVISVKMEVWYNSYSPKTVSEGVKATLQETFLEIYDENGNCIQQAEITLDSECVKDMYNAKARMYADSTGEGLVYDTLTGYTDEQKAKIDAFCEAHGSYELIVKEYDAATYADLLANYERAVAQPDWAKKKGIDPSRYAWYINSTKIGYWCNVVRGTMVLAVEVSTEREAITTQPMILEQLVAWKTFSTTMVDRILNKARRCHLAIDRMLDMALATPAVDKFGIRTNLELCEGHDFNGLKGKELVQWLAKKYPNGVNLVTITNREKGTSLIKAVLHFDALLALAAFDANGTATGIAQVVLTILDYMAAPKKTKDWHSNMNRIMRQYNAAVMAWATSNGVLAKIARTGNILDGRKVRPICSPKLARGQVGLNPNDPLIQYLFINEGDYLLIVRTPMIATFGATVVLDESFPIGMLTVHSADWTKTNCGDGDGDPVAFYKVDADLVEEVKKNIATSPFGPRGYEISFGTDVTEQPYANFFRGAAGPLKEHKNPRKVQFTLGLIEAQSFIDTAEAVGNHYNFFVGSGFAVSSYLTLLIGKKLDAGETVAPELYKACILAWEVYYEDLGLAGYTKTAKAFADAVNELKRSGKLTIDEDQHKELNDLGGFVDHDDHDEETGDARYWVVASEGFRWAWYKATGVVLESKVAGFLYNAIQITGLYNVFENKVNDEVTPTKAAYNARPHLRGENLSTFVDVALIFGTLRRGSKGLGISHFAKEEEDNINCMFKYVKGDRLDMMPEGHLKDTLVDIVRIQGKVAKAKAREADRKENSSNGY